ncbi:3-hydroxyacyl-CoA dehydrogenase NAD-binding domain-containing protein [Psychrobacter lutiphocae]|uniref:3-hydroxyacyl-CoA dehydrogenase NAD-binding domain-containing protein n=1 Tax=Psychrobacter lutiphocae TaxID=540500 RepID=UPI00036BAB68|nr:3-hydroxyacyl-CoA dehydrogenase NAD-binding domain-containing protein [Psychrobacter lutiphocae]
MSDERLTVGVIGAGTMGQGIAQLALQAGHKVVLVDQSSEQLQRAKNSLDSLFTKFVNKEKITQQDKVQWLSALTLSENNDALSDAKLVIEAIVERLDIKQTVFQNLESIVSQDTILATNTSSLSVTAIASCLKKPERFIGLHFFNPPGIMPLVEVIEALQTSSDTTEICIKLMQSWGKSPVKCKNTPGFIVNRVARPFYIESFRLIEDQIVTPSQLDSSLRNAGFKMGPCELTDFIGQDVNYAVSCSVFDSLFYPPHLRPSLIQGSLVEAGFLGRKSGKGFYDYKQPSPHPSKPLSHNTSNQPSDKNNPTGDLKRYALFKAFGNHPWVAEQKAHLSSKITDAKSAPHYDQLIGILDSNVYVYASDGRLAAEWEYSCEHPVILADIKNPNVLDTTVAIAAGPIAQKIMEGKQPEPLGNIHWTIVPDCPGLINLRVLSMIINEAAICATQGIATPEGIDKALKGGVNYPLGAFEWLDVIGIEVVINTLETLRRLYGSSCYTVPPMLMTQSNNKSIAKE